MVCSRISSGPRAVFALCALSRLQLSATPSVREPVGVHVAELPAARRGHPHRPHRGLAPREGARAWLGADSRPAMQRGFSAPGSGERACCHACRADAAIPRPVSDAVQGAGSAPCRAELHAGCDRSSAVYAAVDGGPVAQAAAAVLSGVAVSRRDAATRGLRRRRALRAHAVGGQQRRLRRGCFRGGDLALRRRRCSYGRLRSWTRGRLSWRASARDPSVSGGGSRTWGSRAFGGDRSRR